MSKENGTVELVENVHFFEMKDGLWLTIDGLSKKYSIAKTTVSWKANQFNIDRKKIAGVLCYKDDSRFQYQKASSDRTKHLDKNPTYSELIHRIKDYTTATNNLAKKLEEVHSMVKDIYDHLTRYKTVEEVLGRPGIMDKWKKDNEQNINGES